MRRPLHLHIGHGKAGTSTVQVALGREIERLRGAGFLVADAAMDFREEGAIEAGSAFYVADRCAEREAGLRTVTERFHAVGQQLAGREAQLVVSAESFTAHGAEVLARALRHAFEIHVVYYVRRQDDWIPSAWNQWGVRRGLSLDAYLEWALAESRPDYEGVIARWEAVADTVRVRPLHESAFAGGRVEADFFAAIGAGFEPAAVPRQNAALDLALLETFARSQFLFDRPNGKACASPPSDFARWLVARLPDGFGRERAGLDGKQRERVREHFLAVNRRLHRRWFADLDFDAVFGPTADEAALAERATAQRQGTAQVDRLHRVLGLQLQLIHELWQRLEERNDQR